MAEEVTFYLRDGDGSGYHVDDLRAALVGLCGLEDSLTISNGISEIVIRAERGSWMPDATLENAKNNLDVHLTVRHFAEEPPSDPADEIDYEELAKLLAEELKVEHDYHKNHGLLCKATCSFCREED